MAHKTRRHGRALAAGIAALALGAFGLTATAPASAAPADAQTEVTVVQANDDEGLVLHVEATGYDDLPKASTGADAAGVYAAVRDRSSETYDDINADTSLALDVAFVYSGTFDNGAWSADLTVEPDALDPDAAYEAFVWTAHGNITDDTLLFAADVDLTDEQRTALFGEEEAEDPPAEDPPAEDPPAEDPPAEDQPAEDPPAEEDPTQSEPTQSEPTESEPTESDDGSDESTAGDDSAAGDDDSAENDSDKADVSDDPSGDDEQSGSATTASDESQPRCTTHDVAATDGTPHLAWGVKASFTNYVESGVADGSVSTSGGASRSADGFTWGAGTGTLSDDGEGTVSFPGSVHFEAHDGVLNVTLSNLRVRTTGDDTGELVVDVQSQDMEGNDLSGSDVVLADLDFSSLSATGGNASAALTADGARAFAGFYDAGEQLDPVSLTVTGGQSATTEEECFDAAGNRVNADGSPFVDDELAETGSDLPLIFAGAGVLALGGLALVLLPIWRRQGARR